MRKLQEKRLVKYDCLVIHEELHSGEYRAYMQWLLELEDNFLDKWKKYD